MQACAGGWVGVHVCVDVFVHAHTMFVHAFVCSVCVCLRVCDK